MHGARIAGSEQVEAGQVGPPQESNGELICWKCPVPVTAVGSHMRGSALPINAGASALVLLAWSPDEVRRVLEVAELRRFTAATLTDVDALMERIGRIRRLGHSITRGELDPDVVGIAAPIRDENKQVVAAVSVAALASRVYPEAEAEIAQKVLATAHEISDRMAVVAG